MVVLRWWFIASLAVWRLVGRKPILGLEVIPCFVTRVPLAILSTTVGIPRVSGVGEVQYWSSCHSEKDSVIVVAEVSHKSESLVAG